MTEYLEIDTPAGRRLEPLVGERLSIGRENPNTFVMEWDSMVSRQHAVLEHYESGWSLRDLGSSNGTFVNGKRIWAEQALAANDEIQVGSTKLRFRADLAVKSEKTTVGDPAPDMTKREKDVLVALCRPMFSGDVFSEPATSERIAEELFVSQAAVRQHFGNLYDKFNIPEGEGRRVDLANEAIRRHAVDINDMA